MGVFIGPLCWERAEVGPLMPGWQARPTAACHLGTGTGSELMRAACAGRHFVGGAI